MKPKILASKANGPRDRRDRIPSQRDTTLLEYDAATADMEEVNRVIAEYEAKTGAQPFDMATGETHQENHVRAE